MTDKEKELALYCLKASSGYHSETCEECINYSNCDHTGQDDVTETIIKALEQEPCEDAIYRQAVLKEIPALWNSNGDKDYCMETLRDFVTELPPVTPTRKVGHWEYDYNKNAVDEFDPIIRCPFCGYTTTAFAENEYDCCPKCGSYLKGGEDGNK